MISENPLLNGFEIKDKISIVVGFSQSFTPKRVSSFATNIPFTNKVFMPCNPGIKSLIIIIIMRNNNLTELT